jgi:putative transposase
MKYTDPLIPGSFYHIYNRGNNRENLFRTEDNYLYFLRLYEKYIEPIGETFAWCLMPNHFHFLVRIKNEDEVDLMKLPNPVRVPNPDRVRVKKTHLYFSDMFNAYTQGLNKQENRSGALFERPFKRIKVESMNYLKQLIIYIHRNPIHHGFTDNVNHYPWSSYGTILSITKTNIPRGRILGWFDDKANFIKTHDQEENDGQSHEFFL